jgi:acyl-CoA thioester hydrolase
MARYSYHCPMRWADQDPYGHINNTLYLAYLEQARVDVFFRLAGERGLESFESGVVIVRHEIDYLRPVVYRDEPLRIDLWCGDVRGASFTVRYEVFDGVGDAAPLAARAQSQCATYDLAAGRPRRLTEAERAFVAEFGEPEAGAA